MTVRGSVPELISPHPLGAMLPGIYQTDDFAQRFTAGLDDVIAPVLCTLDNLSAYFDPGTAPSDFLDYVAQWVGIDVEASWSTDRRRQVIAHAVELHRRRGTARGIREAVALVTRAPVEVRESGASAWSRTPGADLPGDPGPRLVIRIGAQQLSSLERRRIDALVEAVKPAHVPHEIELGPVAEGPRGGKDSIPDAAADPTDSLTDDGGSGGD